MLGPKFRKTHAGIEFIHAAYIVYWQPTVAHVHELQEYLQRYPFGEKPKAMKDLEFSLTYVTTHNKRLKTPLNGELTQRGIDLIKASLAECLPHEMYFVPDEGSDGLYGTYSGLGLLPIPDWPATTPASLSPSKPAVKLYHLKPLPVIGKPLGFVQPPKVIATAVESDPPTARQHMYLRFWGLGKVISKKGFGPWRMRMERELSSRALAWHNWKIENPALNASNNPDNVPLGIGYEYLKRIEDAYTAGEEPTVITECPSALFVEIFGPAKPAPPVPEKTWISKQEEEKQGFAICISFDTDRSAVTMTSGPVDLATKKPPTQ